MKRLSSYRTFLAVVTIVGVLVASAGLYFHGRLTGQTTVPLSNQALVGTWSEAIKLPTGKLGQRHYANFPAEITFRPDGTVFSSGFGATEADYAVHGKLLTISIIRFRGKSFHKLVVLQASLVGDILTLTKQGKPAVSLRRN